MTFTDEPGIYIPGELGIRHEDVLFVTDTGAENMTKWSGSPEEPAVVWSDADQPWRPKALCSPRRVAGRIGWRW
jgi:hypothetical protein